MAATLPNLVSVCLLCSFGFGSPPWQKVLDRTALYSESNSIQDPCNSDCPVEGAERRASGYTGGLKGMARDEKESRSGSC
jgi:hypothetical protein